MQELHQRKKKKREDTPQRVKELDHQYEEVCKDIEYEDDIRIEKEKTMGQRLKEAAYILEEKYKLLGQEDEINTISATINERFKSKPHITRYTSEYLDAKYKRQYNTRESYGNATDVAIDDHHDGGVQGDLKSIVKKLKTELYGCNRGGAQDIANVLAEGVEICNGFSEDTGIPLLPPRMKKEHIASVAENKISLEPGAPITDEELLRLGKLWAARLRQEGDQKYKMADDIEKRNFLAVDPDIAREGIKESEAKLRFYAPVVDDRPTADHEHWIRAIERRLGACDKSSREWRIKYELDTDNDKVKEKNPMVKEQFDIRYPAVCSNFHFMFRHLRDKAIFKNWRASKHKKILEKEDKLGPKLSESA